MILLETDRLVLRNWREGDRDLFFEINSDPEVMAFFPFQRTRQQADALMDRLHEAIAAEGIGFAALALKADNTPIGFAGLSRCDLDMVAPGTVEIGWRLARRHWGYGYVTEAGRALLRWGFETIGLAEIVAFAVAGNRRSTAVMERIGLHRDPSRDFDHPGVPDTTPHLMRHVFYALTKAKWQEVAAKS